jgi:hypothetical protein
MNAEAVIAGPICATATADHPENALSGRDFTKVACRLDSPAW